jgi:hypothetical protein
MSSPIFRGFLIGGLIGVILHLIVRFILGNLVWIALAVMLIWVLAKCSPENPRAVSTRAILNSFDRTAVRAMSAQGITTSYATHVAAISTTVSNGGSARIYDLRLYCSFKPSPPSAPSKSEAMWDVDHVRTSYHYGYVNPGQTLTIRLIPEPNPSSFSCEPLFEIERSDLLKNQP